MIELLLQAERALSVGMLDQAEALYRQVAEADPRNSIAFVGLARVALERGDESGALELGRRALKIDPQNAAAQRLVQRLEEVRAYRGEPDVAAEPEVAPEPAVEVAAEPQLAAVVAPVAELAPAPTPAAPVAEFAPVAEPAATVPPPSKPRRRSLLDRLLRRDR